MILPPVLAPPVGAEAVVPVIGLAALGFALLGRRGAALVIGVTLLVLVPLRRWVLRMGDGVQTAFLGGTVTLGGLLILWEALR